MASQLISLVETGGNLGSSGWLVAGESALEFVVAVDFPLGLGVSLLKHSSVSFPEDDETYTDHSIDSYDLLPIPYKLSLGAYDYIGFQLDMIQVY